MDPLAGSVLVDLQAAPRTVHLALANQVVQGVGSQS